MTILSPPARSVRPDWRPEKVDSWQAEMKDAIRLPSELCELLELPEEFAAQAELACRSFPLFAPRTYVARMKRRDPRDPLLRQVMPMAEEAIDVPGFVGDPVGDAAATISPGLLQKYAGRALLIATGACAVHCRYCFRRHFPYETIPKSARDWEQPLADLAADQSLREVILSGGDPLTLADNTLAELVRRLANIRHLRRLRVHTRLPIIIPQRVTEELLAWLCGSRLTPVVVIHANHAQELAGGVPGAIERLITAGAVVLNQAVLLRGVNDSLEAQLALCECLVDLRVIPYYLHQLDRVAGAAHFEVPIAQGKEIVHRLRSLLPGYAVPRFVQEIHGAASKTLIA